VSGGPHERWSPYPTRVVESPAIVPRVDPVVWGTSGQTGPLTASDIERYAANGFTSVDDLVDERTIARLLQEVDFLCSTLDPADERVVAEPGSAAIRSVFAVHELSATFADLLHSPRLLDPVRQLLGENVYIHQSRINRKPPFHGKEFGWHSDFETWHAEDGMPRMRAVSVSIALSENRRDNGSLMIIAGSHRHFVCCVGATPEHHHRVSLQKQVAGVPDEASITQLAASGDIVTCVGPAGSATIFDCNCLHGSSGNITPFGRTNVFVVYNAVDNALQEPFSGTPPRPAFLAERDPTPIP
jgi:ectoine hydroxylase